MSADSTWHIPAKFGQGIIRIERKGMVKFAFGEDGQPFDVDVVTAFQEWIGIAEGLRDENGEISTAATLSYQQAAVDFSKRISGGEVTTAQALQFLARLREQYDELAVFFQPRSREKLGLPASTEAALRFSVEEAL